MSHAKSLQPCLTFCDPMDCSSSGSNVYRILQARILEWVVISSSRRSSPNNLTNVCYLLHGLVGYGYLRSPNDSVHWQMSSKEILPPTENHWSMQINKMLLSSIWFFAMGSHHPLNDGLNLNVNCVIPVHIN